MGMQDVWLNGLTNYLEKDYPVLYSLFHNRFTLYGGLKPHIGILDDPQERYVSKEEYQDFSNIINAYIDSHPIPSED